MTHSKKPENNKFAKALRKIRESQFLTRSEFANKLGLSLGTIEAYEYGFRMPSPKAKLLSGLGMNTEEIIAKAEAIAPQASMSREAKIALGKSTRTLRKAEGMSQQALADAIHTSQSAIANWENGRLELSMKKIKALVQFFGCITPSELHAKAQNVTPLPKASGASRKSDAAMVKWGSDARTVRESLGMTRKEVADAIHLSRAVIGQFEAGAYSLRQIEKVSQALVCASPQDMSAQAEKITSLDRNLPDVPRAPAANGAGWVEKVRKKRAEAEPPPHPTNWINTALKNWPLPGKVRG